MRSQVTVRICSKLNCCKHSQNELILSLLHTVLYTFIFSYFYYISSYNFSKQISLLLDQIIREVLFTQSFTTYCFVKNRKFNFCHIITTSHCIVLGIITFHGKKKQKFYNHLSILRRNVIREIFV